MYDWYGVLPREVISQFEKETKIKVNYDVFDNNEMLEAKLLASNSGYDVVFPTATPYAARQLALGIYQKIDKSLLPNLKEIEPFLVEKMKKIDENFDFLLPYYWGTTGIAFDEEKLDELLPEHPKDSYSLLFDINVVSVLKEGGINFLQEAVDIFPFVSNYLGLDRENRTIQNLVISAEYFSKICPFIRRFSSSRFVMDLVLGDICITQAWSGGAIKAIEDAEKIGRKIKYIIPKEGCDLWIDVIAIPVGAPHRKNAHKFINFLLRPEISAQITNKSQIATMVCESKKYIEQEILENTVIFPSKEIIEKLFFQPPFLGKDGKRYNHIATRLMNLFKMSPKDAETYIKEIKLEIAGNSEEKK
ncbi:MAG: extracellular solute-binding protein [Holosporales bacterium]|nr:extracellular solute-binding protein [Holosporales bacterium]